MYVHYLCRFTRVVHIIENSEKEERGTASIKVEESLAE